MKTHFLVASLTTIVVGLSSLASAQMVAPNLLNNTDNGAGDEPAGLVNFVSASSRLGGVDDPREIFGRNTGPIENGNFYFADAAVGTIHTVDFSTASAVFLNGLQVIGGAAGPQGQDARRIMSITFFADLDNNGSFETTLFTDANFPDTGDGGSGMQTYSFGGIMASSFRLAVEAQDGPGARLTEVNAVVPEPGALALVVAGGLLLARFARRRK